MMPTGLLLMLGILWTICEGGRSCTYDDDECEFHLYVENHLTMMHRKDLVYSREGKLYLYDVTNPTSNDTIPLEDVISCDGYLNSRVVTVANNSLPGPPLIVYEGQMITIHVHNDLKNDAVTIHWHGLPQKGTPWMDGVAFITQCPILPSQTFTYKFRATPAGTFWYHSHIGNQRSMGLNGALIIRKKKPLEMDEHIFTIQDWNHDWDSDMAEMKMTYGVYEDGEKVANTQSIEGAHFSMFTFQSGLINGRGRFYDGKTGKHNDAPLSKFTVIKGKQYRFRMIGTGVLYPFRVSIDNHWLLVVATDGMDVDPVTVQSIIINPGERYDFVINATQNVANYWIRAQTLEVNLNHTAEAILHYQGADDNEPRSSSIECTMFAHCLVLNCPFLNFPPKYNATCLNVDKLSRTHVNHDISSEIPTSRNRYEISSRLDESTNLTSDIFLNFAFPGTTFTPGSVNGRKFYIPPVAGLTQMEEIDNDRLCDSTKCGEDKVCYCFHSLNIEYGQTYHLILVNMGIGKGWAHPIHMHGHSFEILKMGFAQYDKMGQIIGDNPDIDCRGNGSRSFCNEATWSNKNWHGNNIPGLETRHPPLKDTVIVPSGGYVIIRIKADNPGLWFMHCHIELHALDGMAMVINESLAHIPPPPEGFPVCRDFRYHHSHHEGGIHRRSVNDDDNIDTIHVQYGIRNDDIVTLTSGQYWTILSLLLLIVCLLITTVMFLALSRKQKK